MNEATDSNSLFVAPRVISNLSDCYFYHTMDLPGFGVVRGHWDLRGKFDEYIGGVEVTGKSVLDIGTATGFLTFEAEKKAARVVSFDMSHGGQQTFLPFKDKPYYTDHAYWANDYDKYIDKWKNAYWLCHRLLASKAQVYYGNVYDLPPQLGTFDVSIVGSVLEHLSDQVTALASIARLTKETMILVTPLLQSEERLARFEPRASNPDHDYTWWTYSVGVYREVLAMLGFSITRITRASYYHQWEHRLEERSTLVADRSS
ncbi:MAG: class I SAM-dependent methyltransferase [Pyrinomonadaceae bacterium]